MTLTALALVCTLKPSPAPSSSELLGRQLLDELAGHGVEVSLERVVDHDIRPGVSTDEGHGDAWPALRARVLAADILVITTPIWLGHTSSVAARVLERLDAELSERDAAGRLTLSGTVAIVGVVGNEDGAHHVSAEIFQALDDVGATIPSQGATYWVGEAMQPTDYRDLDAVPETVAGATATAARNAVHLAGLLRAAPYPV